MIKLEKTLLSVKIRQISMKETLNMIAHGLHGEHPDGIGELGLGQLSIQSLSGKRIMSLPDFWRTVRKELRETGKIDKIMQAGQDVVAFSPGTLNPRVVAGIGLAALVTAGAVTAVVIYKHHKHQQEK